MREHFISLWILTSINAAATQWSRISQDSSQRNIDSSRTLALSLYSFSLTSASYKSLFFYIYGDEADEEKRIKRLIQGQSQDDINS